jgi:hypothetical protein
MDDKVIFEMVVRDVSGAGLSRTVTAQITNNGISDAHNTSAKVEVLSMGQRVQLSGEDYLMVDIGMVKARGSILAQVTLEFTIWDGLRIRQGGARFVLTVSCHECTQVLSYDYRP